MPSGNSEVGGNGTKCGYEGCGEPAWDESVDGFCLYHARENGRDESAARAVWERARERVAEGLGDFSGCQFPADPDGKGFKGATLGVCVGFVGATFDGVAPFEGATFVDTAVFDKATFLGSAEFAKTVFRGGAWFNGATFHRDADFAYAAFQGMALYQGVVFEMEVLFDSAVFHDDAIFEGATFRRVVRFLDAVFRGLAMFARATFTDEATFFGAVFEDIAEFELANAEPGTQIHFDLPSWPVPFRKARPFQDRPVGDEAYRLAKRAAYDRGDYREAGAYHYAEQCAINRGTLERVASGPRRWQSLWVWVLELLFARGLFGYGEKPHRALIAGLLVIFVWTGLFYSSAAIGPGWLADDYTEFIQYSPRLGECLHFSAVTFTTLGYGDLKPKPGCRALADAEAFMGAALMALFIVGLTRKYTR